MRVIIVEDEKITRQWVKRQMEKLYPQCSAIETFANGKQALSYMETHETDVLFTDIRMPVMDGLELLANLQKRGDRSYKVILSAYDEFHYAQQALRLGANEFTLKPEITKEELGRILEEAGKYLGRSGGTPSDETDLRERQEIWMRQMLGQTARQTPEEIEAGLREHGIDLDREDLMAVCIAFPDAVSREKVTELLHLYFAEEKVKYFCLQMGVHVFCVFFNRAKTEARDDFGQRLWELLRVHVGMDVYIGLSAVESGYEKLGSLCRQAAAAKENRLFFEISGCQRYDNMRSLGEEETLCGIQDAVEANDFDRAQALAAAFLDRTGQEHDLHPAGILAAGREILTGYMRKLRAGTPTPEEAGRLRQCELTLGRHAVHFSQFRGEVLENLSFLSDALRRREKDSGCSPAVRKIMQYVEEHYKERISLEQVAAAAFLSRSYASVLFKKETGERFSDYLQRIRVEKSCRILRDSGVSIQEAADQTGFFDAAHFSRVFKEKMGVSPLEYRRRHSRV